MCSSWRRCSSSMALATVWIERTGNGDRLQNVLSRPRRYMLGRAAIRNVSGRDWRTAKNANYRPVESPA